MNVDYLTSALKKYLKILSLIVNPKGYFIYSKRHYKNHKISFSQEGEDLILRRLFNNQTKGFYIDIGAHHPQRFSNTYYFYLNGWQGMNIDAMPGSMKLFDQLRPLDINLEIAVSAQIEELNYYQFDEPALNTFSQETLKKRQKKNNYSLIGKTKLKPQRLSSILEKHLPKHQTIDFMNIDVEGFDYEVLKSNNWNRFRPKVLIIEDLDVHNWEDIRKTKIYRFLTSNNYILHSRLFRSCIYMDLINQD